MSYSSTATAAMHEAFLQSHIEAFSRNDPKLWLKSFSGDVEYTEVALQKTHRGIDELTAGADNWFAAFTDHCFEVRNRFEAIDSTAVEWSLSGAVRDNSTEITRGALLGRRFTLDGVNIMRFDAHGKVCWQRTHWDLATLLRQIGIAQLAL